MKAIILKKQTMRMRMMPPQGDGIMCCLLSRM